MSTPCSRTLTCAARGTRWGDSDLSAVGDTPSLTALQDLIRTACPSARIFPALAEVHACTEHADDVYDLAVDDDLVADTLTSAAEDLPPALAADFLAGWEATVEVAPDGPGAVLSVTLSREDEDSYEPRWRTASEPFADDLDGQTVAEWIGRASRDVALYLAADRIVDGLLAPLGLRGTLLERGWSDGAGGGVAVAYEVEVAVR